MDCSEDDIEGVYMNDLTAYRRTDDLDSNVSSSSSPMDTLVGEFLITSNNENVILDLPFKIDEESKTAENNINNISIEVKPILECTPVNLNSDMVQDGRNGDADEKKINPSDNNVTIEMEKSAGVTADQSAMEVEPVADATTADVVSDGMKTGEDSIGITAPENVTLSAPGTPVASSNIEHLKQEPSHASVATTPTATTSNQTSTSVDVSGSQISPILDVIKRLPPAAGPILLPESATVVANGNKGSAGSSKASVSTPTTDPSTSVAVLYRTIFPNISRSSKGDGSSSTGSASTSVLSGTVQDHRNLTRQMLEDRLAYSYIRSKVNGAIAQAAIVALEIEEEMFRKYSK